MKSLFTWAYLSMQDILDRLAAGDFPLYDHLELYILHEEDCPSSVFGYSPVTHEELSATCTCDPHLKMAINPWINITVRAPRNNPSATKDEILKDLQDQERAVDILDTLSAPTNLPN